MDSSDTALNKSEMEVIQVNNGADCFKTVSEMVEKMHENDLFDIFPEFSKVVHILAVIPATSCSAGQSFSALHRLRT